MMTTSRPIKSRSTVSLSICLLRRRPRTPPQMPPETIRASVWGWNSGMELVRHRESRFTIWLNRMIYKEFAAARLVSMAKK